MWKTLLAVFLFAGFVSAHQAKSPDGALDVNFVVVIDAGRNAQMGTIDANIILTDVVVGKASAGTIDANLGVYFFEAPTEAQAGEGGTGPPIAGSGRSEGKIINLDDKVPPITSSLFINPRDAGRLGVFLLFFAGVWYLVQRRAEAGPTEGEHGRKRER